MSGQGKARVFLVEGSYGGDNAFPLRRSGVWGTHIIFFGNMTFKSVDFGAF